MADHVKLIVAGMIRFDFRDCWDEMGRFLNRFVCAELNVRLKWYVRMKYFVRIKFFLDLEKFLSERKDSYG